MRITFIGTFLSLLYSVSLSGQVSRVWVSDLGDGRYKNPVINADYSDPDVCRVGADYYMVSSSFNCIPGLQILHSNELVNWTLAGYALSELQPAGMFDVPRHGGGVWAPAIRFHEGVFYIYYPDPDLGIFMTWATDPRGEWSKPVLVKGGKGLIDPCPLWDDDGKAYLVHAYAGSRAGMKSVIAVAPMLPTGTMLLGESRIVFDGHKGNETVEGPKFYKRNGYYYIFAPAGGVATGWQLVLRSKSVWGPYEQKIVMAEGKSGVNGPHQGAWVDTETGEDWFLHFQDKGVYGRVVHLQPMEWHADWPVIGIDREGKGCGEPVAVYRKPNVGHAYPVATPADSDEFDSRTLGLQWQWHANSRPWWHYCASEENVLRLFSVPCPGAKNLWDRPNLLMQKLPAEEFAFTAKVAFCPSSRIDGERAGIVFMGSDYATLYLEKRDNRVTLSYAECIKAENGAEETVVKNAGELSSPVVYLRMRVDRGGLVTCSYSTDNRKYLPIGARFTGKPGRWIGAKVGLYCNRPLETNDGGWIDVDWVGFEK